MGSEKIRVGVVGAGPSGLACLRVFLQFPDRYDVVAFEARSDIGGVWYLSTNFDSSRTYSKLT